MATPVGDWDGDMVIWWRGATRVHGHGLVDVHDGVLLVLIVGGRGGASDSVQRPL